MLGRFTYVNIDISRQYLEISMNTLREFYCGVFAIVLLVGYAEI